MFNLDKNQKYLVAVSGGVDSMALLDMLYKGGYIFKVAHINYHQRNSADIDASIVRNYCLVRKIEFFEKYFDESIIGNFQNQARIYRYHFFKKLMLEINYDYLLTAHHLDDFLETYLFQKQRKSIPEYYGIKKEVMIFEIKVIRPLLSFFKDDLINYCNQNQITYGFDESNLSLKYTRNQIRHQILSTYNKNQKLKLFKEINELNKHKQEVELEYQGLSNVLDFETFLNLKDPKMYLMTKIKPAISKSEIIELLRQLKTVRKLNYYLKKQIVIKNNNLIKIVPIPSEYSYIFIDEIALLNFKSDLFKITNNKINDYHFCVNGDDFPLTIRNFKKGDKILMKYGFKKINRFLIDKKIDYDLKKLWPIVLNAKGEIIFVYGLGSDKNHFQGKQRFFMVKY